MFFLGGFGYIFRSQYLYICMYIGKIKEINAAEPEISAALKLVVPLPLSHFPSAHRDYGTASRQRPLGERRERGRGTEMEHAL